MSSAGDARPAAFETLDVDWSGGRVRVRLDRSEQRNAINLQMVEELHGLLAHLEREPRLLVLTGGDEGIFSGGADVGELRERRSEDALAAINLELFERLRALPLPTVAAIDGPALGGGAELAYACDLRLATPRATFGQPEVRLGIMAAAGGCFRLAQLVGEGLAKEMLFTGDRFSVSSSSEAAARSDSGAAITMKAMKIGSSRRMSLGLSQVDNLWTSWGCRILARVSGSMQGESIRPGPGLAPGQPG